MSDSSSVDWSLANGNGYVLDHSHISACRLNLQNHLWKEALGFIVHPSIQLSNESVIADVATGTGAWLLDVIHLPDDLVGKYDYVPGTSSINFLTMDLFASSLVKMGKVEAAKKWYGVIQQGYQESTTGAALCIPRLLKLTSTNRITKSSAPAPVPAPVAGHGIELIIVSRRNTGVKAPKYIGGEIGENMVVQVGGIKGDGEGEGERERGREMEMEMEK
ncbi:hypothetical protein SBOR_7301 [Sclerotinia borealis F-4128]|uniref:Methyltransferase domain-containing protein n=1 Tax=Sclerotinia borealis (strain F-4128) TaxID=1432307 RepID=W9CCR7_SCLBF|nr:hypothetical protein SBOR_7301 [Sclerotinia borealis F-4128]